MDMKFNYQDQKDVEFLNRILDRLVSLTGDIFEVDGSPTVTVIREDGEYRKRPLIGSMEFSYQGYRIGKTGPLFLFDPVEKQTDWVRMELAMNHLDTVLPMFTPEAAGKFSVDDWNGTFESLLKMQALIQRRDDEEAALKADELYANLPNMGLF